MTPNLFLKIYWAKHEVCFRFQNHNIGNLQILTILWVDYEESKLNIKKKMIKSVTNSMMAHYKIPFKNHLLLT